MFYLPKQLFWQQTRECSIAGQITAKLPNDGQLDNPIQARPGFAEALNQPFNTQVTHELTRLRQNPPRAIR